MTEAESTAGGETNMDPATSLRSRRVTGVVDPAALSEVTVLGFRALTVF